MLLLWRRANSYLYNVVSFFVSNTYNDILSGSRTSLMRNTKYVGIQRIGASTNDSNMDAPQCDKTHVASRPCGCLKKKKQNRTTIK